MRAQQRRLDKIACACRLLEQETPVTLASLAQAVAMSPFHLHRLFKASTGMTPKGWQQAWRARRLREALAKGEQITAAIYRAGFPDSSSYYRHADQTLGMTAKQFRKGGDNVSVRYALTDWVYGRCPWRRASGDLRDSPGDSDDALLAELHTLSRRPATNLLTRLFSNGCGRLSRLSTHAMLLSLPLDIQGTAFQQLVWQALCAIPCGETVSYQQLAATIGKPTAVRAVASACGANKLAMVIPCHRVVRRDGALSGYRWACVEKRSY